MACVVTDIDGTITDAAGRLDWAVVSLMAELERGGIPIGLISGRPYPVVRALGEYLGLSGPLIAENGGVVLYRERLAVLGAREEARRAFETARNHLSLRPTWDNASRATDFAVEAGVDLAELSRVLEANGLEVEIQASSIMVHFARKGVTKRAGLEHWLNDLGIPRDTVLVAGDSDSDLSLFEGFPFSVAPANCTEAIARLAAYRAERSFGSGFCEGVDHFRRMGRLV